ncbi:hypothetical protein FOL47_002045 [Perkinsus chesapeaki]|uniref:Kelch domain containing n=1 Tax=Perkinsus chesapeaki TaxID=330153 RepID=A0A7J6MG93_PERCH|nr:hypothetical protein FOL47_002045 [Perkinsus chesapeaki]
MACSIRADSVTGVTGHSPSIRNGASLSPTPDGKRYVLFGGDPSESSLTPVVYALTETYMPGRWMKTLPTEESRGSSKPPPVAFASSLVFETSSKELYLIVHGGIGYDRVSTAGTFAFDLQKPRWRRLFFAHGCPPPRDSAGLCTSPVRSHELLLFGGISNPEKLRLCDMWSLDLSDADWDYDSLPSQNSTIRGAMWRKVRRRDESAIRPSPRDKFAMSSHDPSGSVFVFGGGTGKARRVEWSTSLSNELWRLDATRFTWEIVTAKGAAPPPCQGDGSSSWLWSIGDFDLLLLPKDTPSLYAINLEDNYWYRVLVSGDICRNLSQIDALWAISPCIRGRGIMLHGNNAVVSIVVENGNDGTQWTTSTKRPAVPEEPIMLRDAEELVMKSRKAILALEENVAAIGTAKRRLLNELEQMRGQAGIDEELIREGQGRIKQLQARIEDLEAQLKGGQHREQEHKKRVRCYDKLDGTLRKLFEAASSGKWDKVKSIVFEAEKIFNSLSNPASAGTSRARSRSPQRTPTAKRKPGKHIGS